MTHEEDQEITQLKARIKNIEDTLIIHEEQLDYLIKKV
jgi:hypothetical protein